VAFQIGVTLVTPRIAQVALVLRSARDKPNSLLTWTGSDVLADERYRLDAVFSTIASLIIHEVMMG